MQCTLRLAAAALAAGLAALSPVLAQPAAPGPQTTIPEKIAPPADNSDLSEKLDRSGGVIPPPADPGPGIEVAPEWKDSAAERRVAAWTMRYGRARRSEPLELRIGCVDVVGHHRPRAGQRVPLVHGQIVLRPRKKARDFGDLAGVLVEVRLNAKAVMRSIELLGKEVIPALHEIKLPEYYD